MPDEHRDETTTADAGAGTPVTAWWVWGRTTAFLLFFTLVGTAFHLCGKLNSMYIGFIVTIMTFVLGHSIKEDWTPRDK